MGNKLDKISDILRGFLNANGALYLEPKMADKLLVWVEQIEGIMTEQEACISELQKILKINMRQNAETE